ncbi:MAG: polyphosphate kinase 1 [Methylococcaceae bacterium]|nr:MAG: polyphosphate kinase 1 [Methylococcaceae bacterium]
MSLANVKGVGKSTQAVLCEHGIFSVEELAAADMERLAKIPGFGKAKALRIVRAAKALVGNLAKARISRTLQRDAEPSRPKQAGDPPSLTAPELYINRELSQLEFNRRVLAQAEDTATPLLERLNFLCISCSNMDEFFEVRVASVLQKADLGSTHTEPDNFAPAELLTLIGVRAHELVAEQYRMLNEVMLPALEEQGIRFLRRTEWSEAQLAWLKRYFDEELLPILSPIGLDSAHPFPRILNKSLNFIISLSGKDAFGRNIDTAVLQAPRALPRIVQLPAELTSGANDFVFLSSIIHTFADELFQGMKVKGCWQFRVTRNSELYLDEEATDDLLMAVEGELASRNYGDEVRLEVAENCPDEMVDYLQEQFNLTRDRLYRVAGPVNLSRMRAICDLVDRPDLKYPPFVPGCPSQLLCSGDIFQALRRRDVLLHHPYESFSPVVEMIRQSAIDPDVLAIKQTLYRTGPESAIVDALVNAARAGKEVTVVIELLARFDEKANISLANRLQEAGAQVVYGIVGYKTHAKMLLILRRENKQLRYYVHLSTGNYHPSTAKLYTDYGLFSSDAELGEDVRKVFVQLTSLGRMNKLQQIYQSPFTLHKALLDKIEREREHAMAGRAARIVIKVNSVVESQLIQALYRASMAGVEIKLIVRGVCCLRPGVAGVSEHIEVRSIVGRFLEHSRVISFSNGGETEVYLSSADLMDRNMFRRVEVCFPVRSKKLQQRILDDLEYFLKDNTQAWILQSDGSYRRLTPEESEETFQAQAVLLEELKK